MSGHKRGQSRVTSTAHCNRARRSPRTTRRCGESLPRRLALSALATQNPRGLTLAQPNDVLIELVVGFVGDVLRRWVKWRPEFLRGRVGDHVGVGDLDSLRRREAEHPLPTGARSGGGPRVPPRVPSRPQRRGHGNAANTLRTRVSLCPGEAPPAPACNGGPWHAFSKRSSALAPFLSNRDREATPEPEKSCLQIHLLLTGRR
jgi:hypothetical protein